MSKKNTTDNESNRRNRTINVPDVYNMDMIGYMQDEDIAALASRLESERNHLIGKGQDTYIWEVEICYLRREQQMRKQRAERHAEYLATMSYVTPEEFEGENVEYSNNQRVLN